MPLFPLRQHSDDFAAVTYAVRAERCRCAHIPIFVITSIQLHIMERVTKREMDRLVMNLGCGYNGTDSVRVSTSDSSTISDEMSATLLSYLEEDCICLFACFFVFSGFCFVCLFFFFFFSLCFLYVSFFSSSCLCALLPPSLPPDVLWPRSPSLRQSRNTGPSSM